MMADLLCYLEDDVAIGLVELAMEGFVHLEWNEVLYLPHCYTRNLQDGEIENIIILKSEQCKPAESHLTRSELRCLGDAEQ